MLTMFTMRHGRRLAFAAAAALALAAPLMASHSWSTYHWARPANPFTLRVADNVSAAWDSYLVFAINDWSASSVLELTRINGTRNPRTCQPTAGRIEACSYAYGRNGWLGLAQIWASGSHITQATTKLNDSYFGGAPYNTPAWRRMVTCQELAHDLGLDHQDTNQTNPNLGSCMDYTNNPTGPPTNEFPNAHDFAQLETIYAHLDAAMTADAPLPTDMPPAMTMIDFATPGQWGRVIGSSRDRRIEVYELDFGRGYKLLTQVFWADPEGDAKVQ